MTALTPIHPFPARMAPEIALRAVSNLPPGSLVLDPMAGSGTVLRTAADKGHSAIGYDLDPLAVLMAMAWNTPIDPDRFEKAGYDMLARFAGADKRRKVPLPWIDRDPETATFISEWFAAPQRRDLRILSHLLRRQHGAIGNALRIAFSRLIIRKQGGASLGDDVSHSRPHRRHSEGNDFDTPLHFEKAFKRIARIFREQPPSGRTEVRLGDGRQLAGLRPRSVSAVVTSPPYLNAIDYMRGHKLTLVWLGYQIRTLALIRSTSVGAERAADKIDNGFLKRVLKRLGEIHELPNAQQRMVDRYIMDLRAALSAAYRVLSDDGTAVFVVGNSCLRDVFVRNSDALEEVAQIIGFVLIDSTERELPAMKRYLPPPVAVPGNHIEQRMRTEVVMRFHKSAPSNQTQRWPSD
jgi:DNA modification methylase